MVISDEITNAADRRGILSQFNVVRTSLIDNTTTPLQVGNGNFAFNVDNTGMQVCPPKSFPQFTREAG